ncbi:MAG: hypothetical protein WC166_07425 [Bacteroidales bacterium]|jgi:hypothetical protein
MTGKDKNNETKARKDQMIDLFLDTGTDSMTEWGTEFIKTNVPKTMDWIVARVKDVFASAKTKGDNSIKSSVRKAIQAGIEIGEENKEQAITQAMIKAGISDTIIKQILDSSCQYLVTWDSIESQSKK